MALSALYAINMPELITNTEQAYKEMAIELARNPKKLKQIKEKLEKNRQSTSLFDSLENTRHIENAYLEMFRNYQNCLPNY